MVSLMQRLFGRVVTPDAPDMVHDNARTATECRDVDCLFTASGNLSGILDLPVGIERERDRNGHRSGDIVGVYGRIGQRGTEYPDSPLRWDCAGNGVRRPPRIFPRLCAAAMFPITGRSKFAHGA